MISWYFMKIKSLCYGITKLDPNSRIPEARMRRIIIHGLRPDYHGYIVGVRGWQTQPTLLELKGLSAVQETLIKQMARFSIKNEDKALFSNKENDQ